MDILDKIETPQAGKKVEEVLADGYQFDFGDYLGKAFSLFGKEAGYFIGFSVLYFVISFVASYLLGSIGIPFLNSIFSLLIGSALSAGIYTFMKARNEDYGYSFNAFFDGFKSPYWGRLVLCVLVQGILSTILLLLIILPYLLSNGVQIIESLSNISNTTDPEELMALIDILTSRELILYVLLAAILSLALTALWILAPLFILNRNMGFWEAMEASRKIVSKKFLHFVGLLIVLVIMLIVGALPCGLGLPVAYPVLHLAIFAAYSHIMEEPIRN